MFKTTRRSFLKALGFGTAATVAAPVLAKAAHMPKPLPVDTRPVEIIMDHFKPVNFNDFGHYVTYCSAVIDGEMEQLPLYVNRGASTTWIEDK